MYESMIGTNGKSSMAVDQRKQLQGRLDNINIRIERIEVAAFTCRQPEVG